MPLPATRRPIWLEFAGKIAELDLVIGYLLLFPLNFLVSGLLEFCLNWLAAIPWRRSVGAHWTERARLLWPARASAATNVYLIPLVLLLAETVAGAEVWSDSLFPTIAALLGSILGTYPLAKETCPRYTFGGWLRLVSMSWALRFGFLGALVISGLLMPDEVGIWTIIIGGIMLLYILAWNFGLYSRFLRWFGVLRSPPERLRAIVTSAAGRMGTKPPCAWLLVVPAAYAAALPTMNELFFSTRLLEIASDDEVAAVCAHELAHLSESRAVLAGRIAGSLTFYPLIFLRPAANFGPSAVIGICGFLLLSRNLKVRLSRRMEKRADKIASDNQAEIGVYARALECIYRDNLAPAVGPKNLRAHPNLYDRMLAAGVRPDYAAPPPPDRLAWPFYLVFGAIMILVAIASARPGAIGP